MTNRGYKRLLEATLKNMMPGGLKDSFLADMVKVLSEESDFSLESLRQAYKELQEEASR